MKRPVTALVVAAAVLVPATATASSQTDTTATAAHPSDFVLGKREASRQLGATLRRRYYEEGGARNLFVWWTYRASRTKLGGRGSVTIGGRYYCGRFWVREYPSYYNSVWDLTRC